ncbi:MAG TPA: phosphate signaling complex protein PhoU [Thermomicrobiales bacterium]|jgi:phosphate transport system protein|nr:phosphate signaling complex protein PhoU [Thermomicrobiales bacterium]
MDIRSTYHAQIRELRDDVVAISSMVDKAVARATDALKQQNIALARDVIRADREINDRRWDTEERALSAIALQQPMARDLRVISAVISIVTDLERMGDHAVNVAKIVVETSDEPLLKPLVVLPRMSDLTRMMLADAVTAFIHSDISRARSVIERDALVDDAYQTVYRELLGFMLGDASTINRATRLLAAAHDFERIGDRVKNICERVIFSVTGDVADLSEGDNFS